MPLSEKEQNIMNRMRSRYGREKGEHIFYASARMGKLGAKAKRKHFPSQGKKEQEDEK